jgi:hypothetical protein
LVLIADMAASLSASLSHFGPLRVRPERRLPATVVARALACPGAEVTGGREHRHVDPDLTEDVLRSACLDPAERAQ